VTVTATPIFVQAVEITPAAFTNADSANTKKTVATAGANGSKVLAVTATSTETANARVAQLWLTRSAVSYLLASANIPLNSGFDGTTVAVNLLALFNGLAHDNDGQAYLFLMSGDTLQVSLTTQVASGKEVDVVAHYGNF
jgi:hypothetical protein